MKLLLTVLTFLLFFTGAALAQDYQLVYRTSPRGIELKWYNPKLVTKKTFTVMRRENNGEWITLNTTGIKAGNYAFTAAEISADKELREYKDLATSDKLESFGLLMATLKSFESIPFSKCLGIYFRDSLVNTSSTYDYKIVERAGGQVVELCSIQGLSASLESDAKPVDSLDFQLIKKGVSFHWKPESNRFYGVNIYRSDAPGTPGELITTDPILLSKIKNDKGELVLPEWFYTDERLNEKQTYYYTFVGLNFFGDSLSPTEQVKVRIKDDTPPGIPGALTKQIFDKKVMLAWSQDVIADDMIGYHIYATRPNDTLYYRYTEQVISPATMNFELEVQQYALYSFRVAAVDEEGNETLSDELFAEVLDKIAPIPPQNVVIVPDTSRLVIQWTPNSEPDIMGYKIYRSIKGNKNTLGLLTAEVFPDAQYVDSLPSNAINSFSYTVIALDSNSNESAQSELATNVMIDITPPKSPFLKSVSMLSEKEVLIKWVKNTELDHAGYSIFRKNDSDSLARFAQVNIGLLPADITEFKDRSADERYTYSYYIIASDQKGNTSPPSNIVRFRMPPKVGNSNLKISVSRPKYDKLTGSVKLKWKAPYSETSKYVVFKKNASGTFIPVSAMLDGFRFTDTAVEKGSVVEYQVRIYDDKGNTQKSETVSITVSNRTKKTR